MVAELNGETERLAGSQNDRVGGCILTSFRNDGNDERRERGGGVHVKELAESVQLCAVDHKPSSIYLLVEFVEEQEASPRLKGVSPISQDQAKALVSHAVVNAGLSINCQSICDQFTGA